MLLRVQRDILPTSGYDSIVVDTSDDVPGVGPLEGKRLADGVALGPLEGATDAVGGVLGRVDGAADMLGPALGTLDGEREGEREGAALSEGNCENMVGTALSLGLPLGPMEVDGSIEGVPLGSGERLGGEEGKTEGIALADGPTDGLPLGSGEKVGPVDGKSLGAREALG
jgi:hypothetical protein